MVLVFCGVVIIMVRKRVKVLVCTVCMIRRWGMYSILYHNGFIFWRGGGYHEWGKWIFESLEGF